MSKKSWQQLQPLRIPAGWTILFNKLENLEPETLSEQDENWLFLFTEDIMYLSATIQRKRNKQIEAQKLSLDLGWYPDGDPKGSFHLLALLNDNWDSPLLTFTSRSKKAIVETLEQWLFEEFMPLYFIDEQHFHRNYPKNTISD